MRTKFLSILASFLVLSLAITSCLDSDKEYELSSDNIITAFELDSIYYGKYYKFTIDQINGLIFNADSVPVSADTIIDKILIKTLNTNGYVTAGPESSGEKDTLFNYADSIDLSKTMDEPLVLRIRPYDGSAFKTYRIEVRRHIQDPDSLVWWGQEGKQDPYTKSFSNGNVTDGQKSKTVYLDNKIFVFTVDNDGTNPQVYSEAIGTMPENTWSAPSAISPTNINITSTIPFLDKLYTTSSDGKVYSSTDGATWTEITTDGSKVNSLLTTFNNKENLDLSIAGIIEVDSKLYFAKGTFDAAQTLSWEKGGAVPVEDPTNPDEQIFPTENISATKSYTTATGLQRAVLIAKPEVGATDTYPWFSENDGLTWTAMQTDKAKYALPVMENPSIIYYGKNFYAFGGDFSTIYTSVNGMVWEKVEKKFLFPNSEEGINIFKDRTRYSMTVDKNNYIWIVWHKGSNYTDQVWRGKLNRLGFKIQD